MYLQPPPSTHIQSVVEDNTALQFQLVKELVYHNDIAAAVYWAGRCELPVQQLPFSVQIQLEAAQRWASS